MFRATLATSLLFSASVAAAQENNPFSDFTPESLEVIGYYASKDKDLAYQGMKEFAECVGLFEALSLAMTQFDQPAAEIDLVNGMGRGAKVAGVMIYRSHSEQALPLVVDIATTSKTYFLSTLEAGFDKVIEKQSECMAINQAQIFLVDEFRKLR